MQPQQDAHALNPCMCCVLLSGMVGSPGAGELLLGNWALGRVGAVRGISDETAKEEEKQAYLQPCLLSWPFTSAWTSHFYRWRTRV